MNLVTGGAGFIGSHLVQQLLNSNQPVRVLEHPSALVSHLPLEHIELVRADIQTESIPTEEFMWWKVVNAGLKLTHFLVIWPE